MTSSQTIDISASAPRLPELRGRFDAARGRIEHRFLDGGAALASALEEIGEMTAALDEVTASLRRETVEATVLDLTETSRQLLELPAHQARRQESMRALAASGQALGTHIEAMLETLRYLRTFAVTVKITGAGAHEFAGFADEMLEKIESGRVQVDGFASRLSALSFRVGNAIGQGRDLEKQYQGVVPRVARDLEGDAIRMGRYYEDVAAVADALRGLVRSVQGRVGRALSALQIGDMTRQRVEHVQAGLLLAEEAGNRNVQRFLRLLGDQTVDLLQEFHQGCGTVTSSMSGLADDTKEILSLGRKARGDASGGSEGFLKALESSVTAARTLVDRVEASRARADEVSRSAAETARDLANAVDSIRAIKTEIQHMAINTSLRCSRMGDAGKPMNVVASELRVFAEQMETVAGRILAGLDELSLKAADLSKADAGTSPALGQSLDAALGNIRDAGAAMTGRLKELASRGDEVARRVSRSAARLDFTRELGEVLEECALALDIVAAGEKPDAAEDTSPELAGRLFASYTMARERDVHRRHFDAAMPSPATASDPDDVLF